MGAGRQLADGYGAEPAGGAGGKMRCRGGRWRRRTIATAASGQESLRMGW